MSRQLTKTLIQKEELSKEEFVKLEQADPTPQKKYMFWMTKQYLAKTATFDQLRNYIEEFDLFLKKGRIQERDINKYEDFKALQKVVDELNERGVRSNKELEDDYDVDEDSDDLYIASPNTHEASRKLGLSKFAYRKKDSTEGNPDSAWCTTFKTDQHFLDYYYNQLITFYYIKVKSPKMHEQLKKAFGKTWEDKTIVALAVTGKEEPAGSKNYVTDKIEAYDAMDNKLSDAEYKKFMKIINR